MHQAFSVCLEIEYSQGGVCFSVAVFAQKVSSLKPADRQASGDLRLCDLGRLNDPLAKAHWKETSIYTSGSACLDICNTHLLGSRSQLVVTVRQHVESH